MVVDEPTYGEEVLIHVGPLLTFRGTVREVYGREGDRRVVVELTPALNQDLVDEPTTLSWQLSEVVRGETASSVSSDVRSVNR